MLGQHRLLDHHVALLLALGLGEALLEVGDHAVGELSGLGEVAAALGVLELHPCAVELLLQVAGALELVALGLPAGGHRGRLLLQLGEVSGDLLQPVLGGLVALLLQRLGLDLLLQDVAVELVELLGLAVHLHAQARGRLVHQVDGLVGQEAVGDVARRQGRGRDQ